MAGLVRKLMKLLLAILLRMRYRVEVVGSENVPESGPVLVLSNHISYLDAVVIGTTLKRPVRFIMFRDFFKTFGVGAVARMFNAISVSSDDSPEGIRKTLNAVIGALKQDELVCLFPEGGMTRTGHLRGFKRGFELIARRANAPIVPVYLDRLWGSNFSFSGGKFFFKWPRGFRRSLTLCIGAPLPPDAKRNAVRQAVMELGADAFVMRKRDQKPLHVQFWRTARRKWFSPCMADSGGQNLSWGKTLVGALMLSRWIRNRCAESADGEKMIGIMLPATVGTAIANIAALFAGKTPVNLNFTTSQAAIDVAMEKCALRTVLTSRKLLQKANLPERPEYVYLEDVMKALTGGAKITSFVLAAVTPAFLAERWLMQRGRIDDLATVMFTSGSTGKPKGVMLSHHNVVSNIQAMTEALQLDPTDTIMSVLPPFHSFGFTTTLWLPLTQGLRVIFHPNPLDAREVGRMVEKHCATLLMGTPSFFALYTRGCKPEQFRSLRLIVAGGQKLLPTVAEAFEKRFGIPLSEGYGCTELSPVVSANVPDVMDGDKTQKGTLVGSVGRPLPGVAVRVVNRETYEPVSGDESGIVLIKGANVMQGYLNDPGATARVIRNGWYITADIGIVDDDGFLHIQDRASRFSKIAGEMVPHAGLEDALYCAAENEESKFVVVAFPDHMRGEKLVVLYSGPQLDTGELLRTMTEAGVPNLWFPATRDFIHVDELPLLASGKTDLVKAKSMAESAAGR